MAYRLIEPERWAERRVLVVGGGNSAVEAATALADAGAATELSYRGALFNRVAPANMARLEMQRGRNLQVILESNVRRIEPHRVTIETPSGESHLDNDQVFVLAGGELPTDFLDKIGVRMRWHHGERTAGGAAAGGRV